MTTNTKYLGIDISEKLIGLAKNHPEADFYIGDGSQLDIDNNSFDNVISLGTTVHDQNYENLINECFRVSKNIFYMILGLYQNTLP